MELPNELKIAIEKVMDNTNIKQLKQDSENISFRYRNKSGKGNRLLTENSEAISYSIVRMPSTYAAIYSALKNTFELYNEDIKTMLDIGAGTGAGSWAANSLLELKQITCLEREDAMINLGKSFMKASEDTCLQTAEWKKTDLVSEELNEKADLVICSYVLNEMDSNNRMKIIEKLWNATKKILVIIEPGTPVGFNEIRELREHLIGIGGKIVAPCPNIDKCPIKEDDWCHSTVRVSRSKIHKLLKDGDVPYEDEKFSYIAICKDKFESKNIRRVLRHPHIESGKIELKLCTVDGIQEIVVTKKDKENFKSARKAKCGEIY